MKWLRTMLLGLAISQPAVADKSVPITEMLYKDHCSACHGINRLGAVGSALLPENLRRVKKSQAKSVITSGRALTQMPGFSTRLSEREIDSLVEYIYTPLDQTPVWNRSHIDASHIDYQHENLSPEPIYPVDDRLNLFIVVELADHSASLLDGDKLEVIHRFKTRAALHGGPKFSADGRYVYFASRDGWISKFDIYNLKTLYEVRAGINTRNIALSSDGKTVLVANYLPHNLVILDAAQLTFRSVINAGSKSRSSRVSAVYSAPKRNSFIAALKDIPEVWEITYQSAQSPTPQPDRIATGQVIDDFFFSQDYRHLIGSARDGEKALVIDLDNHKTSAEIPIQGLPHLGSGFSFDYKGSQVLASQNLRKNEITFIDMDSWQVIKVLQTAGPGFFMRSHEKSNYAMADVFFGKHKDQVTVIDKRTLEIAKTLIPQPGKTSAHIEFDRHGKYALISIWEDEGALAIYDMNTLEEVKRIPMKKPSGKYNIYNKITFAEGTSH